MTARGIGRIFQVIAAMVLFSCWGSGKKNGNVDVLDEAEQTTVQLPECPPGDPLCIKKNGRIIVRGATVQSVSGVANSSCTRLSNQIYCLGGTAGGARFSQIWQYDYSSDRLMLKDGRLPTGREQTSCVGASNGRIYCFGGYTGEGIGDPYLSEIVEYDPGADFAVLKNSTLPKRRAGMACAAATNGRIYCFGGTDGESVFNSVLEYDPQKDLLIAKQASMPSGASGLSCVAVEGRVVCFGGSQPEITRDGFSYVPSKDTISPLKDAMGRPATSLSCVSTEADSVTCLGGSDGSRDLSAVTRFDVAGLRETEPKIKSEELATLAFPRSQMACVAAETKVYCFGGTSTASVLGAELSDVLEYDAAEKATTLKDARIEAEAVGLSFLSCASAEGDRSFCFGGLGGSLGSGTQTRRVLEYNFDRARLDNRDDRVEVRAATLPTFRAAHSCVAAANGKIYCLGGLRGSPLTGADLSEVVEYDVGRDSTRSVRAILPKGRWGMGCALGGDRIYCLGGVSGNVLNPSRSFVFDEILEYDPQNPDKLPKTVAAKLPGGRALLSCAPAQGRIYCFGGAAREGGGLPYAISDVLEYDFTRDLVSVKASQLSRPLLGLSCASYSDRVYCFGGASGVTDHPTGEIFEYDPVKDVVAVKGITMPSGRLALSCASNSRRILCFGGFPEGLLYTGSPALANSLSQVIEYCPPPCEEETNSEE